MRFVHLPVGSRNWERQGILLARSYTQRGCALLTAVATCAIPKNIKVLGYQTGFANDNNQRVCIVQTAQAQYETTLNDDNDDNKYYWLELHRPPFCNK